MKSFTVYTDGSFGDNGETHGGIAFSNHDGTYNRVHVYTKHPAFVSMRNVGGEVLAAWSAIMSFIERIKKANNEEMETYELIIVYDYKGIGEWLTGGWKTNKTATQWFVQSVRKMLQEVPNVKLRYVWVKGHSSTAGNNEADRVSEYSMNYARSNNIPICNMDEVLKEVR